MRYGEVSGSSQTAVWGMAWGGPDGAKRPARRGSLDRGGTDESTEIIGKAA